MTLWLRSRRIPALAAVSLAVIAAAALSGARSVALPLARLEVEAAYLLPAILGVAANWALAGSGSLLDLVASRRMGWWDAGLLAAVMACEAALFALAGLAAGNPWATGAGRNAVGFIAVAMLASRVAGWRLGGGAPIAVMIGIGAIGRREDGVVRWWAWPLASPADPVAWAIVATLALAALGVAAVIPPKRAP